MFENIYIIEKLSIMREEELRRRLNEPHRQDYMTLMRYRRSSMGRVVKRLQKSRILNHLILFRKTG